MSDQQCAVCDREIHSITTRRVGDHTLCITCGDKVNPLVRAITNAMVERIAEMHNVGMVAVSECVKHELDENFAPFISDPAILRSVL